jgi:hypothetical protein
VKRFVSLQFLNIRYAVGLLGHRQTSMPRVGFEPTIPAFGLAKTVHVIERAITVIGSDQSLIPRFNSITFVLFRYFEK